MKHNLFQGLGMNKNLTKITLTRYKFRLKGKIHEEKIFCFILKLKGIEMNCCAANVK